MRLSEITGLNSFDRPSEDQKKIIDLATDGHNVYFGGLGGCGKTFVANCILKSLKTRNVRFACTCTTGIACTLYTECSAQTIHSFAGVGVCHGPKEELLRNILLNEECIKRWRKTDVLFIDEISMLSEKTFEILHYVAQNVRGSQYVFGGIQILAFGDFLQLPPVTNYNDNANYAFQSVLWDATFPHQIILHKNFRAKDEDNLISLVKEVSVGNCSEENVELIKSLSRPLNPADLGLLYVPKLFPLNDDADFANACILDGLSGDRVVFESYDTGDTKVLNRELLVTQKLALKVGAQVMFTYNINDNIKNGVLGSVVGFSNDLPVVRTDLETIVVKKVTWSVYDRHDSSKVVGTRTQIPLKLAWAMTIHKAQGKTLPAVEVHCNNLFAPGHLYVAISRVKALNKLCVIGFDPTKHIIPPPKIVLDFLNNIKDVTANKDHMCCHIKMQMPTDSMDATVHDSFIDDELNKEELDEFDDIIQSYFTSNPILESATSSGSNNETINMSNIMDKMSSSATFHKLPEDFDYSSFLLSLKSADYMSEFIGSVSDINQIYDYLLGDEIISHTKIFLGVQWNRIFEMIRKYASDNVNTVVTRKGFTSHFGDLHNFLTSNELETEFAKLIGNPVSELSEQHFHALTEIILNLNKMILSILVGERTSSQTGHTNIDIRHMNDDCLGKVRYCGAWAIAKIKNSYKKYFKCNIHSSNDQVRMKAKEAYIMAELLSQLIWSSSFAHEHSHSKDTLTVTLLKNYEKGNLVHITDDVFKWILDLEQERVNLLNKLNLSIHQDDLVEHVLFLVENNEELLRKWKDLFSMNEILCTTKINIDVVQNLVCVLFKEVIIRYVKMGVGEFLREFRRDFQLQKTEAHRKRVVEKKKKKDLKSSKVTVQSIRYDSSVNKNNSHSHLLTMIEEQEEIFQSTVYSKSEIQLLCKAYGLVFRKNDSKSTLSGKLIPAIRQSQFMPYPLALCETQQQSSTSASTMAVDSDGRFSLVHAQTTLRGNALN